MANKFPLILNTSANQIQEIASGDNLDLTGCKIVGLQGINSAGIVTFTKAHVGAATTWGEDLVVTGNARVTGILTVGTNSVTISGNDVNITGVTTASNFKTGTSNLHNVGIELAGINVLGADTPIGTGATIYDAGGAVFTGVVTATNYVGTINTPAQPNITSVGTLSALNVSGNVSIGGTLTYEDVTNIDAVGLITARNGINVSGGTATFAAAIDANSDLDVDGHTNLDNVSIAGVTTATGAIDLNADLDVDGHTNLDNVSIAGVTTFAGNTTRQGSGAVSINVGSTNAGGASIILDGDSNGDFSGNDYSLVQHNTDGHLIIQANAPAAANVYIKMGASGHYGAMFKEGAESLLRYNNSTKIETTNTGALFTGTDFGFGATPGGNPAGKAVFLAIGDSDTGIVQDGDGQLELWANNNEVANINAIDGYTSTKPITTTGNVSVGDFTAKSSLFTDDGTASPIVDIRADDASPWQLQIANDTYGTGAYGLNFHLGNTGIGFMRNISKDTNFRQTQFGCQNSSGTHHHVFNYDNVGMRLNTNYDLLFDGSGNWTGDARCKLQHHSNALYMVGGTGGIRLRSQSGVDGLHLDSNGLCNFSQQTNFSGAIKANSGAANAVWITANGDLHFDGDGSWTGNNRTKIQYHSNCLYLCGGTSGTRFRNRGGSDEVYLNDSCEWQNFKLASDIRFPNGTSTWTGESPGKIQHHGNWLYMQGGSSGFVFRSSAGTDRWYINSDGHFAPASNNTYDIGTSSVRVRNIYTNDLNLSNEGSEGNDVDGTWGNYTIQEGEDDLFLINRRSGKKYKFNLTEVS